MTETDFQQKVLGGVEALQDQQASLVQDYDRLSKETKRAFEELTHVKNKVNDFATVLTKLQQVRLQLGRESRMAYGDPIERLIADEGNRTRLNCAVRLAMDHSGDMQRLIRPQLKALGEDSSPGSTLITADLANEIFDTLASYGKWSTLGVRRVSTKQTKFPVKTARPVALVLLTEADTIADDTNKAGTSVTGQVELIATLLNVSMQLLEDAESDVTADVMNDFAEAFNYRLDYLAFRADGTSDTTNGGMTGLFNFGTASVAADGNTTIENMDLEDFIRCLTTVASTVLTRKAKWWLHPHMLARSLAVKDANGRPLFLTATEAPSFGGIGSILGYPVELVEAAPSTNAADSPVAAFGDPQGYVVGVRRDFNFEASDHHKWNTFQRSFRGIGRAGTKGRRADAFAVLKTAAT